MIYKFASVLLAAGVALASPAAFAAETPATPPVKSSSNAAASTFVEGLGKKALSSLTASDLPASERETRVRSLLRSYFDVPTISRFVLGQHWNAATEAQKREYQSLFEEMIVKTYTRRFADYSGQSFKVGNTVQADGAKKDALVASEIVQPNGPPVNVQWRVRSKDGGMKIVDVIVEGVSMSVTQRDDFNAVVQQGGGIDALIQSLKDRTSAKADTKK